MPPISFIVTSLGLIVKAGNCFTFIKVMEKSTLDFLFSMDLRCERLTGQVIHLLFFALLYENPSIYFKFVNLKVSFFNGFSTPRVDNYMP